MSERVRIVPVTPRAFDVAAARPGAVLERLKVMTDDLPWPIDYDGLLQAAGHYLVRDVWISDAMSGRYVLNFKRQERELEQFPPFFTGRLRLVLPDRPGLYLTGAW